MSGVSRLNADAASAASWLSSGGLASTVTNHGAERRTGATFGAGHASAVT